MKPKVNRKLQSQLAKKLNPYCYQQPVHPFRRQSDLNQGRTVIVRYTDKHTIPNFQGD